MGRKRVLVLAGIAAAILVMVLLWERVLPSPAVALPADDTASRLAFAARWLLAPATMLLLGIGAVAAGRFFVPEAMDGSRAPTSRTLEISLRYNRNTLEQLILAAIAWMSLALVLPHDRLAIIPTLAILFVVGRVAFWIGYRIAPWARAFGFALTFYPTVAAYLWLIATALR
jgi:hypothetical protein